MTEINVESVKRRGGREHELNRLTCKGLRNQAPDPSFKVQK